MSFKEELFGQFSRIGKALSNANRLQILDYLAQAERSVEELSGLSGLSVANTSQHLQQLRQAGLVQSHKRGLKVFYRINSDDVVELLRMLRVVSERHLADVNLLAGSYLGEKDQSPPLPREELCKQVEQGQVTVIDVRPADEFASGHLPGAINVPPDQLQERLRQIDPGRQVVAYCRGPYCVYSFDAVEQLRKMGFTASRLEEGFPEWKSAGYPVESSTE